VNTMAHLHSCVVYAHRCTLRQPTSQASDGPKVRERLDMLFDQIVGAVSERDLSSVIAYACTTSGR